MRSIPVTLLIAAGLTSQLHAQSIGIASLPEHLPKTAVLIEKANTQTQKRYVPLTGLSLPLNEALPSNVNVRVDSNLYINVETDETVYEPRGSGVLLVYSGLVFIATANHVVSPDGDVCFRIPQRIGGPPRHELHSAVVTEVKTDWVRDEQQDIAVSPIRIFEDKDDVKAIPLATFSASFDEVKVGDDIFVLGFPSSVVFVQDPSVHFVRNGIVASKTRRPEIVIDAFLFPGNSGGPVFWKPSMGIHFGEGLKGEDIPGRDSRLVGIVHKTLSYREEAKSPQTGRTRIVFEDNAGLALVTSADALCDLMRRSEITRLLLAIEAMKKGSPTR